MVSSLFKITFRKFKREIVYTVINITGLSLATTCCLIIGLYLKSELTYDRHFTGHNQIYRVVNEFTSNGKSNSLAVTSRILGPMLVKEYPEIKECVRFWYHKGRKDLFRYGDKSFYWEGVQFASDNVFNVFDHKIIYGDPKTALIDPSSIAVSESFAKKYFGNTNPIGKLITTENTDEEPKKITLVFADLPENSHLKYDVLISYNIWAQSDLSDVTEKLTAPKLYTYLLMPENYDVRNFKNISESFYKHHMEEFGKKENMKWRCWLQPLADIHYSSDLESDEPNGNKFYLYGFAAVAIFIMLVACINYVNLATAQASKRTKEIGMQKILGSGKARLAFHFVGEAVLFSMIAMIISIFLVEAALNLTPVNEIMGKVLVFDLYNADLLGCIIIFSLVLGLLSGIYPAFFLSSIMPLSALVTNVGAAKGNIRLRGIMVLIQFTISACVIACTLVLALQMRYISNTPLGFKKENRLIITLRGADLIDKIPTIKNELLKNNHISGISFGSYSSNFIRKSNLFTEEVRIDNNDNVPESIFISYATVGKGFVETMGMELLKGKDFFKELPINDDEINYIVNETLVRKMGWDQPLGKHIKTSENSGKVIGVVKDFHNSSFESKIAPFFLQEFPGTQNMDKLWRKMITSYLVVNIDGQRVPQTINFLKENFEEFDPGHPFEFEFLDDSWNQLYISDQHLMKLVGTFSIVCIFISSMGLFGLMAFNTEQRSKEIAIRKVLGASTWQIINMLAGDILLFVLGGAIVSSVIAYYFMDEWLSGFAYRTDMSSGVFIVSAAIVAIIAFLTITLQSYKIAMANPINKLRNE